METLVMTESPVQKIASFSALKSSLKESLNHFLWKKNCWDFISIIENWLQTKEIGKLNTEMKHYLEAHMHKWDMQENLPYISFKEYSSYNQLLVPKLMILFRSY